jgi:hypothetical protein
MLSNHPHPPSGTLAESVALAFAGALINREYMQAYGLATDEFTAQCSCEDMQQHFEAIAPIDDVVELIEIVLVMDNWPHKLPNDLQWIYIAISGECYSEAIAVVVADEQETLKIRSVEWGRP